MSPRLYRISGAAVLLLGWESLFAQQADTIAPEPAPSPEQLVLEESVLQYRQSLAELGNRYDRVKAELHMALADSLMQLGDFDAASQSFSEALQALRISDGLYADSQLSVLEGMISSAQAEQDWQRVDNNFYLAMNVVSNTLTAQDPRFEKWTRLFANWKIEVLRQDFDLEADARAVEDALEGYETLLAGLSLQQPGDLDKRIRYVREKALLHYYSALEISDIPFDEFQSRGAETLTTRYCYTIIVNGQPTTVCETRRIPNPEYFESRQEAKGHAMQQHVSSIRQSYRNLIDDMESSTDVDPATMAQVVLNLGDMNYLLQDNTRAGNQYRRAWEILDNAGVAAATQQQLMGAPREIFGAILDEMNYGIDRFGDEPTGLVSFDVTARGLIRNLGITGTEADLTEQNRELIIQRLRQSVYRPRLVAGEPADGRLEQVPAAQL